MDRVAVCHLCQNSPEVSRRPAESLVSECATRNPLHHVKFTESYSLKPHGSLHFVEKRVGFRVNVAVARVRKHARDAERARVPLNHPRVHTAAVENVAAGELPGAFCFLEVFEADCAGLFLGGKGSAGLSVLWATHELLVRLHRDGCEEHLDVVLNHNVGVVAIVPSAHGHHVAAVDSATAPAQADPKQPQQQQAGHPSRDHPDPNVQHEVNVVVVAALFIAVGVVA
eukprot:m.29417 g.29417  ORF g.29417 m.29417 type:complete len:227 (+) comp6685_c0_seq1:485-1165(+)